MKLNSLPALCLLAAAAFLIPACKSGGEKDLHSGVLVKNMDTTVNPGDNFDRYVNGTWMKNTRIPADKATYGVDYIVYEKSQDDVKAIIEQASKENGKEGSEAQKIGDLYAGYMDQKTRDAIGIAPLKAEFAKIDAIGSLKDLTAYFAYANMIGAKVPFNIGVEPDFKDPKKYMLHTWQGGLGLPDREYYFLKDATNTDIRAKYIPHIEKMFALAGLPHGKQAAAQVMALETHLASKQMLKEQTRDMNLLYNPVAVKDLPKLMPDFDWQTYLSESGVKYDTVVICQMAYTKDLNAIIKNTPLPTWKAYLKWGMISRSATSLNAALDKQNFDFYSKTLYGVQEQQAQWKRAVSVVSDNLGEMIGKVYVEKHFPPQAKEKMLVLVKNLLKAYEGSIKELTWMGPETKKQALDKLKKFTPKIGYPDKWTDYSDLKIVKNEVLGNRIRASVFSYKQAMAKLGKPVDRTEWGMTPQTVNAYYNPMLNEIVFPAAILQPPYFDMNADDAVNYGAIGAVIGHEIGHGFDDQGSTFDGDGVLRNWWTPQDQKAFKERTNALVEQYNAFKALPDLNVNGTFTLGENIGDLGGLSIALKAYKASLNGKEAPVMDGFTGAQRVFIGWAQGWMQNANDAAIRNQINTDPHSPNQFRVNGVVRNIPEFYEAFNVKPGDSLYLAPEKRVKIW